MKMERRNSAGGRRFLLFTRDLDSIYIQDASRFSKQPKTHTAQHTLVDCATGLGLARFHQIARRSLMCKREREREGEH